MPVWKERDAQIEVVRGSFYRESEFFMGCCEIVKALDLVEKSRGCLETGLPFHF